MYIILKNPGCLRPVDRVRRDYDRAVRRAVKLAQESGEDRWVYETGEHVFESSGRKFVARTVLADEEVVIANYYGREKRESFEEWEER